MAIKYDPSVVKEIRETNRVAKDTESTYNQAKQAREDQRRDERESHKEAQRERRGKC